MGRMSASTGGFDKLKRKLRSGRREIHRQGRRTVERSGQRTVFAAKRNVVENDSVASTELYRSFETEGDPWTLGYTIENTADHAAFVEFGTGFYHRPDESVPPFTAPDSAAAIVPKIRVWIFQKPSMSDFADPWAIAKAIADGTPQHPPGTPAQPFFQPAWSEQKTAIKVRLRGIVRNAW